MYIPDNYDLWEEYEAEQERRHRVAKRLAAAWDSEEREEEEDEYFV